MSAKVFHAHLYGTRAVKYRALLEEDIASTKWRPLKPQSPSYLFTPQVKSRLAEYSRGWKATDIMPVNLLGFQTHRDAVATAFDRESLRRQVAAFLREELAAEAWATNCHKIEYRPFDSRFAYLGKEVSDRPRLSVTRQMLHPNLALNLVRQTKANAWRHVMVSRAPAPAVFVEVKDGSSVFPLYLYPDGKMPASLFDHEDDHRPNLADEFVAEVALRLKVQFKPDGSGDLRKTFGPEDVFHYIYAIFHSPTYRTSYAEFLKIDFPRVPLTSNLKLFRRLCELGAELVGLHLLDSPKVNEFVTRYPVRGDDLVQKAHPKYLPPGEKDPETGKPLAAGRVYLSRGNPKEDRKGQYFEGVPPDVWAFHIGGYQVCEKWLKDRQGRRLSFDDRTHYQKVVVALKETIRLMQAIDAAVPGWPLK